MRHLDLTPFYRSTVGFDRLFDLLDSATGFDADGVAYPPYNIERLGDNEYRITMAVAGFGEDELKIDVEFACQRAHCRKHLSFLSSRRSGKCCCRRRRLAGVKFADNCAGVLLRAFGKLDERRAYLHHISLGAKQMQDASARR